MRKSIFGVVIKQRFRVEGKREVWFTERLVLVNSTVKIKNDKTVKASKIIEALSLEERKLAKTTHKTQKIKKEHSDAQDAIRHKVDQEAIPYDLYPDIYCISDSNNDMLEFLNKLGNEGWETSGRLSSDKLVNAILMRKRIS